MAVKKVEINVSGQKKTVTYGAVVVEPRNYLGADMDEVQSRRQKMLENFRKGS